MTKPISLGLALLAAGIPAQLAAQSTFELGEIVVLPLATPETEARTGASVEVLTGDDLDDGGNLVLADQLARLPGVNVTQQGGPGSNADLIVRGATTRYVAVYIDGIPVNDPTPPQIQFENFGGLSTLGTARVELLKGSQSALYGGTAVAGVLAVSTLGGFELGEGTHQSLTVEGGSYGTIGGSYAITRNTEDLSLSFSASSIRSDGFSAADENDGNTEADGYDSTRIAAGAEYRVNGAVTLGLNGFYETGTNEFDEFGPVDSATFDEVAERDALGARAFLAFEGATFDNELSVAWYQIDRLSTSNGFDFGALGNRVLVTNVTSFSASQTVDVSLGLDYLYESSRSTSLPGDFETTSTAGGFVETVYAPTERLDLIGTVRFDSHSTFGEFATGRLAFAYRPNEQTTWRGAVATGYRPPSISELFADFGTFFGNPDLEPETSVTAEVGVDRRLAGGGEVSATLFWGQIDNLITANATTYENIPGTSIRQGIELAGEIPIADDATLFGAATFTDAETADGDPVPRVPSTDIVIGGELAIGERAAVNANARYVDGIFDAGDDLPSYTLVNAGAEYALTETTTAYIRVENLFDTEYQTTRGYGTSDRAFYVGLRARF
ncbi:MAG: TonB-dependent receptor [Paracoccaceae bacterium]|nr:TonB-dependent receptor [Paracoccaceae bacterium]